MKFTCFCFTVLLAGACCSHAAGETLLYANFDDTICAESRDGEGEALITAGLTDDVKGGSSGLLVTSGMVETENGTELFYSPVIYKAQDNFSGKAGIMEFSIKIKAFPADNRDFLLPIAGVTDWEILSGAEWALEHADEYAFCALERKNGKIRLLFAGLVLEITIHGQREGRNSGTALGSAELRVPRQTTHKNNAVQ